MVSVGWCNGGYKLSLCGNKIYFIGIEREISRGKFKMDVIRIWRIYYLDN